MKNRKTATVTWIKYYNFGSYLQAYALQQAILRLGFENAVLDDSSIIEEGRKKKDNLVIHYLKGVYHFLFSLKNKKIRKFQRLQKQSIKDYNLFKEKFINIDYRTLPLEKIDERYDQFICGSDQIWNPTPYIFSPFYYLGFTNKQKTAYAPSFGITNYPNEFIAKTKPLIQNFDSLSIREKQGAEILEKSMGLKAKVVLDPTLLLDLNDWNKLLQTKEQPDNQEPYILCYFLSDNSWYRDFVTKISKERQLPIKIFATKPEYLGYGYKTIFGGPLEFLEEIKNATYVITDSYHGTIFSLIFEKKFYTLKRFSVDADNNQNSRVENLFSMIDTTDYFIGENDMQRINTLSPLDYMKIKTILSEQREESINYLSNALN